MRYEMYGKFHKWKYEACARHLSPKYKLFHLQFYTHSNREILPFSPNNNMNNNKPTKNGVKSSLKLSNLEKNLKKCRITMLVRTIYPQNFRLLIYKHILIRTARLSSLHQIITCTMTTPVKVG